MRLSRLGVAPFLVLGAAAFPGGLSGAYRRQTRAFAAAMTTPSVLRSKDNCRVGLCQIAVSADKAANIQNARKHLALAKERGNDFRCLSLLYNQSNHLLVSALCLTSRTRVCYIIL